jgi:hypothetical protein
MASPEMTPPAMPIFRTPTKSSRILPKIQKRKVKPFPNDPIHALMNSKNDGIYNFVFLDLIYSPEYKTLLSVVLYCIMSSL